MTPGDRFNPFPGLRPFREDEEHLFFGRENQVDAMVDKLAATRLLAVVGTSGSGKSSLVNCGLRPALRQGWMASVGSTWRMAQFRPGTEPISAMAQALAQRGVLFEPTTATGLSLAEMIETSLRMSRLGLVDVYEQAPVDEGIGLLVVVDQFEELFRYRQLAGQRPGHGMMAGEEATAFVNLLLAASAQTTHPVYVVLTMRSDFLGDCTHFPGLAEAINAGQYLVPRMTRDERRAAIRGPVEVGGGTISPVLLTRLVNDVGDNPDQLSILQHALNRTWANWANQAGAQGPLHLPHYEAIGTMAHALDQHAERAYAELGSPRQRQLCEKLFKALTDKATDPRGVRRPTPLNTLCALADADLAETTAAIDVFRKPSRSFLMPPAGEPLQSSSVIDISHESLMRVWQRLDAWATEEAQSVQMLRRLADTAALHAAGKASLWRDPDLSQARQWQQRDAPNATWAGRYVGGFDAAMAFLQASEGAHAAELAQSQAREAADLLAKERELAQAKALAEAQRQRADEQAAAGMRQRRLSWGLAAIVVLALAAGGYGWRQRGLAQDGQREAEVQAKLATQKSAEAEQQGQEALAQRAQARHSEAEAQQQRFEAQESATLAKQSAEALRKAAHERALEQIRYVWSDLGAKQEQVARIREAGQQARLDSRQVEGMLARFLTVQADDKFNCQTIIKSGFRSLYCSVRNVISFDKIQSISGLPIFRSGPHKSEFNLSNPYEFGHYNPAFLDWMDTYLIPQGMDNQARLNKLSRMAYDTYVGSTVRLLYRTHEVLFASPEGFERFKQRYVAERLRLGDEARGFGGLRSTPEPFGSIKTDYEQLLRKVNARRADYPYGAAGGGFFEERFTWLADYAVAAWANNECCDTWFMTNAVAGFWVRRSIDGTEARMFQMVKKVLQTFEPDVLAKP